MQKRRHDDNSRQHSLVGSFSQIFTCNKIRVIIWGLCAGFFLFPVYLANAQNETGLHETDVSDKKYFNWKEKGIKEGYFNIKPIKKWHPQIELEGKLGTKRILAEPRLFIPLAEWNRSLLFSDIRGTFDDSGSKEGNIGLGFRKIVDSGWIFGGSLFLDFRRTKNDNDFVQGMIGLEALSTTWDFRANYYIPESTKKDIVGSGSTTVAQSGASLSINNQGVSQERALPGWDFEIGRHFPLKVNSEFALYGGWFHFNANGFEAVSGPRARAEMSWLDIPYLGYGSRFTLGGEFQNDDVRGAQVFASARLRIPLQNIWNLIIKKKKVDSPRRTLSPLERRMTDFVVRDVDVVNGKADAPVINEAVQYDGNTVTQIVTIDANTAGGAVAAITAAGENSLIVLDGGAGAINVATTVAPRLGQTLAGGGASLSFTGATSGRTAFFTLPGTRGTLNQTNAAVNGITTTNNTNYTGFNVAGGLASILITTNISDVRISNLNMTGAAQRGVLVQNSGDISITNSSITSGTLAAIQLSNVINATVSNNALTGTGTDGVLMTNVNTVDFSNNTMTFSGSSDGVEIGNSNKLSGSGNTVFGSIPGLPCRLGTSTVVDFTLTFKNVDCR